MTVGEFRKISSELNIPDTAIIYHVGPDNKRQSINTWFIEKPNSQSGYELSLVTVGTTLKSPPPFNQR